MAHHARLGPSGAKDWIACPAKIRLEEQIPPSPSGTAAEAGTIVHNEFERIALGGDRELSAEAMDALIDLDYSPAWAIDQLVTALNAKDRYFQEHKIAHARYEVRVNPGALIGRTDLWGTADIVAIDHEFKTLHVLDLKTGRWPVDPIGNPQLGLYGAGAIRELGDRSDSIETVRVGIIQPAVSKNILTWSCSKSELMAFMSGVVRVVGEMIDDPNTHPIPGPQCKFCRAKSVCPAC
jgi:hypothetical protein